jgi:riboflavin synthase
MVKIGIVDTTFARYDMGGLAIQTLQENTKAEILRCTVPGIKDTAIAAKKLFKEGCDIVLVFGMAGKAAVDKQCAHEASLSLQQVQLAAEKHILEVFVHEDESSDANELKEVFRNRTIKHCLNAIELLKGKGALQRNAGTGRRQGFDDEGNIGENVGEPCIGIVVADFNGEVTHKMLEAAVNHAKERNMPIARVLHVPGAFEIPFAVKNLLQMHSVGAVVTIGAIIKGDTNHDEVIALTVAKQISELSLQFNKPVTLGITGPGMTDEQAVERISYGKNAVEAAIRMIKYV